MFLKVCNAEQMMIRQIAIIVMGFCILGNAKQYRKYKNEQSNYSDKSSFQGSGQIADNLSSRTTGKIISGHHLFNQTIDTLGIFNTC